MTKLKHPRGGVSASVDGVQYDADENGHIDVENPSHVQALVQPPHAWEHVDEPELSHSEPEPDDVGSEDDALKVAQAEEDAAHAADAEDSDPVVDDTADPAAAEDGDPVVEEHPAAGESAETAAE